LLCLEKRAQRPCIVSTRMVPLKLNLSEETAVYDKAKLFAAALKELLVDERHILNGNVSVVLSNNTIFTRFVTLPNVTRSKLNQIIRFEVEQQIPFIIDEVTWAYTTIPLAHTNDLSVLIAAIRNSEIQMLSSAFKDLGISIQTFGICHIAYYNLLRHFSVKEKNILLVDLGDEVSSLVFMEKNRTWGRNLLTGGAKLTRAIMTKLSVDFKTAEKLKQQVSLQPNTPGDNSQLLSASSKLAAATDVTREFVDELLNEILRSISFYLSTIKNAEIDKVILTGGTSSMKGLASVFSERLALATTLADWRAAIDIAPVLEQKFAQEQHYFGAALGWALTDTNRKALKINLLPQEEKNKRILKDFKGTFFSFLVLYIFVILFFSFIFGMKNALRKEQIAQLNSKISYYEQCARYEHDVKDELLLYANRFGHIQEALLKRPLIANVLKVIENHLPDTMWLSSIVVTEEKIITLSGYSTDTLSDISYLKSTLESDGHFENVKIQEANITKETTTKQKIKKTFTITASLTNDVEQISTSVSEK
jgi:type IV pilus assembly protein PilM